MVWVLALAAVLILQITKRSHAFQVSVLGYTVEEEIVSTVSFHCKYE